MFLLPMWPVHVLVQFLKQRSSCKCFSHRETKAESVAKDHTRFTRWLWLLPCNFLSHARRGILCVMRLMSHINRCLEFDAAPDFLHHRLAWDSSRSDNVVVITLIIFTCVIALLVFSGLINGARNRPRSHLIQCAATMRLFFPSNWILLSRANSMSPKYLKYSL